jgi:hypothetical protein
MAEAAKKQIEVLVIGTEHPIQRHQDTSAERRLVRDEFDKRLRQVIKDRNIDLIAEEAGDDFEVWMHLTEDDERVGKYAEAFGGFKTVAAPVPTIAKQIADERPGELRHVDIRAPNAEKLTIEERDTAMAAKTKEILGDADSIVVIVGEDHRKAVAQTLKDDGMSVECLHFP